MGHVQQLIRNAEHARVRGPDHLPDYAIRDLRRGSRRPRGVGIFLFLAIIFMALGVYLISRAM